MGTVFPEWGLSIHHICFLWFTGFIFFFFCGKQSVVDSNLFTRSFFLFWRIQQIDAQSIDYVCLKTICQNEKQEVTLERFSKVLHWFGPFDDGKQFLIRIVALLREPYFFGDLDQDQSLRILAQQKATTFLIRFSSNLGSIIIFPNSAHAELIQWHVFFLKRLLCN